MGALATGPCHLWHRAKHGMVLRAPLGVLMGTKVLVSFEQLRAAAWYKRNIVCSRSLAFVLGKAVGSVASWSPFSDCHVISHHMGL